jgi:hypothetical protein
MTDAELDALARKLAPRLAPLLAPLVAREVAAILRSALPAPVPVPPPAPTVPAFSHRLTVRQFAACVERGAEWIRVHQGSDTWSDHRPRTRGRPALPHPPKGPRQVRRHFGHRPRTHGTLARSAPEGVTAARNADGMPANTMPRPRARAFPCAPLASGSFIPAVGPCARLSGKGGRGRLPFGKNAVDTGTGAATPPAPRHRDP